MQKCMVEVECLHICKRKIINKTKHNTLTFEMCVAEAYIFV